MHCSNDIYLLIKLHHIAYNHWDTSLVSRTGMGNFICKQVLGNSTYNLEKKLLLCVNHEQFMIN